MRNDILPVLAVVIVGLLTCGCSPSELPSASQAATVPTSWTRLMALPDLEAPNRACAGRMGMAWAVSATENGFTASPMMRFERRRDTLPYEIDFAGAIEDPPPAPPLPGEPPSSRQSNWAIGYARDHAGRAVTLGDDGWFVAFDAGEYGGSLW